MTIGGFSPNVGRSSHGPIPEVIKEGFDEATKTKTISEGKLEGMHKETFWDSIEAQEAEKLVIICKDGKSVTYEKGFFNRLLENKPELADLTQFVTIEFGDGSEQEESKAKLCMCGAVIENMFGDIEIPNILLTELSQEDFQGVMHAVENEELVINSYSDGVRRAMDYLDFHPAGVPEGVHGKKDWNARGVDVGQVPPLPKELLEALNQPCPIAKDGTKMIDTHVILWMPPTLNGEPITVNTLEKMATADAFGDNKMPYEYCYVLIPGDAAINQPLEGGYWLALYKKPVAAGESFVNQKEYITNNCPGYEMPKVREVIAASAMQYGCSGDKQERILAREIDVSYSRCEEQIESFRVIVGRLASLGLFVELCDCAGYSRVGVCPVRKFF